VKLRIGGVVAVALLSFAGIAQAAGMFSHTDPQLDVLQRKAQQLASAFKIVDQQAGASRLARGPRGPRGIRGLQGPAGPKGSFSTVSVVESSPTYLCSFLAGACAVGSVRVECPPGTLLTGGGYTGAGIVTTVTYNAKSGNGWGVVAVNLDEVPVTTLRATALCAS